MENKMSELKFNFRSAGKTNDGRPDQTAKAFDRKIIFMNGKRIGPNITPKERDALQSWAISKGFAIVSLYSETKKGRTSDWAKTEPVAIGSIPRLAA